MSISGLLALLACLKTEEKNTCEIKYPNVNLTRRFSLEWKCHWNIFLVQSPREEQTTVDEYVSSHEIKQNVHHIHTRLWNHLFHVVLGFVRCQQVFREPRSFQQRSVSRDRPLKLRCLVPNVLNECGSSHNSIICALDLHSFGKFRQLSVSSHSPGPSVPLHKPTSRRAASPRSE